MSFIVNESIRIDCLADERILLDKSNLMALGIVLVVGINIMITRKLLSLLPQHTSSVVRQSKEN